MKTALLFPLLFPPLVSLTGSVAAVGEFSYIPATVKNTTLADGHALKVVATAPAAPEEITRGTAEAQPNNHWHWREGMGSGAGDQRGVFAAAGQHDNDCPILRTTISGLKPGSVHEVFGFFWVAGYADDQSTSTGDAQWDIRFGLGLADLLSYSHAVNVGYAGTVGQGNPHREVVRQLDRPLQPAAAPLSDRDGDKRLFRVRLGTEQAAADGTLIVYIDDRPNDSNQAPTCYDGVGLLDSAAKAEVGGGAPGALHLAVRAGDWEMARRELAAKAEPNSLDKDGLTPLFYLAAAGDHERVRWLLKSGAKPDVDHQALTPLWAAATSGDGELTKILLQAGAVVPPGPIDAASLAMQYRSPALLHPAVAAIRSGSLPVLQLLLEKEPFLELDALFEVDWRMDKTKATNAVVAGRPHAVRDAIANRHPEMAAFLILHGCRINEIEQSFLNDDQTLDPRSLLISAILARPTMLEVIDALTQRGCPIACPKLPSVDFMVVPWDGLSAAVAAGEADLGDRLMRSFTKPVSGNYQNRLMLLAEASGVPLAVKLVKIRCPNLNLPVWKPGTRRPANEYLPDRDSNNDALRELLPRNHPPAKHRALKGDRVLAVIAAPDAGGPGTALAAEASNQTGWKVVEREEVATLLGERDFANPWASGRHDFAALGDRLSADVLVLVTQLTSNNLTVLRFEAVDVLSGLAIERRHVDAKEFKPEAFSKEFLAAVRAKLQERLEGRALTAVTLLGLTADDRLFSRRSLESTLRTGLLGRIDATPGMITLTREQVQPIMAEKTFRKPEALWNAAWTIEGGIAPLANERIELALRLRSLGGTAKSHDAKASGAPDELPRMIRDVWRDLLRATGNTVLPKERDAEAVAAEGARLLREAEWLLNTGRSTEVLPLVEAALFLGADPAQAVYIQLIARYRTRAFRPPSPINEDYPSLIDHSDPRWSDVMQLGASHLDDTLDYLRLAAESLARHRDAIDQSKCRFIFWNLMDYFVGMSAMLQPQRMDAAQLALLKQFDRELDGYVRLLLDPARGLHPSSETCFEHFGPYEARHFDAVPAIPELLVEALLGLTENTRGVHELFGGMLATGRHTIDRNGFSAGISEPGYRSTKTEILCRHLEKAMQSREVPHAAIRRAEVAFIRSSGAGRAQAARNVLDSRVAEMGAGWTPLAECVPFEALARWVPMIGERDPWLVEGCGFYRSMSPPALRPFTVRCPAHPHLLLPGLVQHAQDTPDLRLRLSEYIYARDTLRNLNDAQSPAASKQRMITRITDLIAKDLDDAITSGRPRAIAMDMLDGASMVDLCFGLSLHGSIRKKFGPRLGLGGGAATLEATRLVDLRDTMADKAAVLTNLFVDPLDRRLLWFELQSVPGWAMRHENAGDVPRIYPVNRPWLLAFDCAAGEYRQRIDLALSPGLWPQGSPKSLSAGSLEEGCTMLASDSAFLAHVRWGNRSLVPPTVEGYRNANTVVRIDRKSGKVVEVPGLRMGLHSGTGGAGDSIPLGTAIGESFFVVAAPPMANGGSRSAAPVLWHLKPDGTLKQLSKPGRRPEVSPFDATDREIKVIRNDNGRLLVGDGFGNYGYYNPTDEQWEEADNAADAGNRAFAAERDNLHGMIFPQHIMQMNDGTEDVCFYAQKPNSGRLVFCRANSSELREVSVITKVPDSYAATFLIREAVSATPAQSTTLQERIARGEFSTVILNQTEEHLILGLCQKDSVRYSYQTQLHRCLPFLWMLDKDKLRDAIRKLESTEP